MIRRLCAVFECEDPQLFKVFYTTKLGNSETESWAKTCRKHAHQAHFPVTWGTIIRVEPVKR